MINICLDCIGDEFVRARAKPGARRLKCGACQSTGAAISLSELAGLVEEDLHAYYEQGEVVPRYSFDSDRPDYEQAGESLVDILQDELEIDFEPAKELAKALAEGDPAYPPDGDEPFFASDQNYKRRWVTSWPYSDAWEEFSRRIKHQQRFFDAGSLRILEQILGEAGSVKADELPIFSIGPGLSVQKVYRARRARSEREARLILKDPSGELSQPPSDKASAGRMNAAGISVFYGALSADTAAAEVRPAVGGIIVVGRFTPLRSLRLLDLTKIGARFTGSIFNPEYSDRAARRRFLRGFHRLIARPVQLDDEPLEYLPTQAVAEYVGNVLGLDGLLYASAQVGAVPDHGSDEDEYFGFSELGTDALSQHNVALFRVVSRITHPDDNRLEEEGTETATSVAVDLSFDEGSAEVWRITAMSHEHSRIFMEDPHEHSDF